jgi:hypothetical protein
MFVPLIGIIGPMPMRYQQPLCCPVKFSASRDSSTEETLGSTLHTWSQARNKAPKCIGSKEEILLWRRRTTDSIKQTTNDGLNELNTPQGRSCEHRVSRTHNTGRAETAEIDRICHDTTWSDMTWTVIEFVTSSFSCIYAMQRNIH